MHSTSYQTSTKPSFQTLIYTRVRSTHNPRLVMALPWYFRPQSRQHSYIEAISEPIHHTFHPMLPNRNKPSRPIRDRLHAIGTFPHLTLGSQSPHCQQQAILYMVIRGYVLRTLQIWSGITHTLLISL